jgi:hypothetical protein
MRKLASLLFVLVVAIVIVLSPLTAQAPSVAAAAAHGLPLAAATLGPAAGVSLLCPPPACDSPLCPGPRGCPVCCKP